MDSVTLRYVGKKLPFTFENPILGGQKLRFLDHESTITVNSEIAEWIFKYNPTGFVERVGEPKSVENMTMLPDVEDEMPKETLICQHCFKEYTDKRWYDKHVERCLAPPEPEVPKYDGPSAPIEDDGSEMVPDDAA